MQGFILEKQKIVFCALALFAFVFLSALAEAAGRPKNHTVRAELPPLIPVVPAHNLPPLKLESVARHSRELLCENSGLENCSMFPNAFWSINDSSGEPRIFALSYDGKLLESGNTGQRNRGVLLAERRNIDWEAIASDESGNLIIADIGNNASNRRNLCFYVVSEPSPFAEKTETSQKVSFYYPTQEAFPDPSKNFDAEACFALNGFIYFFTKQWSNTETVLWRVDPKTLFYQAAMPVSRFNVRGLVTDAALSPTRNLLAILTYHSIWIFELPPKDGAGIRDERQFFSGTPRYRKIRVPIADWQLEGIAFIDEKNLLISSESGALFSVSVEEIR